MHSLGSGDPPTKIPDVVSLDLSYDEITDGEAIGQGGNADVFRVTVERGGRETPVAVKQPRLQGTLDTDTVDQFVQEADVWAELDGHEHIVSLYDWGAEPLPWLAMEYMDRGTLADVPDGERLPLEQALWVGVCVCRAVHHAHRFGVAHHDIKPANVLFKSTDDGWAAPKVSDWGLARLMLNETGSVAEFSPGYAAPEQFDAEEYGSPDDRTDIYQIGTLIYELVTGQPPFEGSATAVMQGVLSTELTPPSEVADVPTELDDVLGEALAKEPDERYESILYLRDRLQELFDVLDEQQSSSDHDAGGMTADSRSVTDIKGGTANGETTEHTLTALSGVDETTAESLAAASYESVEHIAAADQEDLQEVDNVSMALAGRLKTETAGVAVGDEVETAVSELGKDTETATTEPIESVDEEIHDHELRNIEDIGGIDEARTEALREAGYGSVEHIRGASQDELANVDGISVALAAYIKGDVGDMDATVEPDTKSNQRTESPTAPTKTERSGVTESSEAPDNDRLLSRRAALGSIGLGVVGAGSWGLLQTIESDNDGGTGGDNNMIDGRTGGDNGGSMTPEERVDSYLNDNAASGYDDTDSIEDLTGEGSVTIEAGDDFQFDPAAARIDLGTTVTWEWVSENHSIEQTESEFDFEDTSIQNEGDTHQWRFDESGVFRYQCGPHAAEGAHGAIIVE